MKHQQAGGLFGKYQRLNSNDSLFVTECILDLESGVSHQQWWERENISMPMSISVNLMFLLRTYIWDDPVMACVLVLLGVVLTLDSSHVSNLHVLSECKTACRNNFFFTWTNIYFVYCQPRRYSPLQWWRGWWQEQRWQGGRRKRCSWRRVRWRGRAGQCPRLAPGLRFMCVHARKCNVFRQFHSETDLFGPLWYSHPISTWWTASLSTVEAAPTRGPKK